MARFSNNHSSLWVCEALIALDLATLYPLAYDDSVIIAAISI